jgi:oligosaccharide repeat unit polymerase
MPIYLNISFLWLINWSGIGLIALLFNFNSGYMPFIVAFFGSSLIGIGLILASLLPRKQTILDPPFSVLNQEKRYLIIAKYLLIISYLGSISYFFEFSSYYGGVVNLLSQGWQVRADMANGLISITLFTRVSMVFVYTSLLMVLSFWVKKQVTFIYVVMALLPILITGITQAARAGFLFALTMLFFATILRHYLSNNFSIRTLYKILILPIFMITVFFLGEFFRAGSMNYELFLLKIDVAMSYLVGAVSGLNYWFNSVDVEFMPSNLGKHSFASFYQLIGLYEYPPGFYGIYVPISDKGYVTNIFTSIRPGLEDFGYLGFSIGMILLGFMYRIFWFFKHKLYGIGLLIWVLSYIIMSPIVPLSQHNNILLSFLVIFCFFIIRLFRLKK